MSQHRCQLFPQYISAVVLNYEIDQLAHISLEQIHVLISYLWSAIPHWAANAQVNAFIAQVNLPYRSKISKKSCHFQHLALTPRPTLTQYNSAIIQSAKTNNLLICAFSVTTKCPRPFLARGSNTWPKSNAHWQQHKTSKTQSLPLWVIVCHPLSSKLLTDSWPHLLRSKKASDSRVSQCCPSACKMRGRNVQALQWTQKLTSTAAAAHSRYGASSVFHSLNVSSVYTRSLFCLMYYSSHRFEEIRMVEISWQGIWSNLRLKTCRTRQREFLPDTQQKCPVLVAMETDFLAETSTFPSSSLHSPCLPVLQSARMCAALLLSGVKSYTLDTRPW